MVSGQGDSKECPIKYNGLEEGDDMCKRVDWVKPRLMLAMSCLKGHNSPCRADPDVGTA